MKRLVKVVMFLALAAFICFPVNQANALTDINALNLTAIATENDPFFAAWGGMSVFRVRNTLTATNDADLNASLYFNGNGSTQSLLAHNGLNWNFVDPYVVGAFGDTFVAFSFFPGTGIVNFYDANGGSITSITKAAGQPFVYTGPTPSVPEPATMLLFGLGLLGLAGVRRKLKK